MLIAAAVLLAGLAGLNAYVARSWLYPPAIFAAYWAALLVALAWSDDIFYPVDVETISIFVLGAVAFSVGGLFVLVLTSKTGGANAPPSKCARAGTERVLDAGFGLLVIAFPLYWARLKELSAASGLTDFWVGLRHETSVAQGGDFGVFAYLSTFATFLALVAMYKDDGSRRRRARTVALVAVALVYHVLSTSRSGALFLLFALIAVAWMRSGKVRLRPALVGAAAILIMFSSVAIVLDKAGSPGAGPVEDMPSMSEHIRFYVLGGLAGFDGVVQGTTAVDADLRTFRFFLAVAGELGLDVTVPPLVLGYTFTPIPTNVYTIYYPFYADLGSPGVAILMVVLGGFTSWIYRAATRGSPPFVILYGAVFASLMLSNADEQFFTTASHWIQLACCTWLVYGFSIVGTREVPPAARSPVRLRSVNPDRHDSRARA